MDAEEFAARRRKQFVDVDELLEPIVRSALRRYANGEADWYEELVEEASGVWQFIYLDESPNADPEGARYARFRESLAESLGMTTVPEDPPDDAQIERVTKWVGTYTVNDATWNAAGARGVRAKRWVTMRDSSVRETHVVANGQTQPITAPFIVGGYQLRFPGDPVGPPEIWINCRCVMQPAARRGELNVTTTTFVITDDEAEIVSEEEIPADELEEDEEEVTEVPVHGVLAPEGVPTGDGRQFGVGALTNRELPLPIAYQLMSAEGHLNSVTVGRIDEVFREGNEMRFRGMLVLTKEHTPAVIEGIIDGTVRGVSVDVDDVELEMSDALEEVPMDGKAPVTVFSHARIAGVTIVPIPAFQEAFISLGHEFADEMDEEALAACAACAEGPEDDENPDIEMGYDVYDLTGDELENWRAAAEAQDGAFRNYTAEERKRMAESGEALPDGSYPIADEEDLRNAIQAIGRASDPEAARAHIKKRARALGMEELIPEGWALAASAYAMDINLKPTEGMASAAQRALDWISEGKAGSGFEPATAERARKIVARAELTPDHVRRMASFFARHAVDKTTGWNSGEEGFPTPGRVAWDAWGGDAGATWSKQKWEQIKRARDASTAETDEFTAELLDAMTRPIGEFAPGTKDGRDGTMGAWSSPTSGPRPSSMIDSTTTSAGTGLATGTARGMGASPQTEMGGSVLPTGSSMNVASGASQTVSYSTTSAGIGSASTHGTSNPSQTASTWNGETPDMAGRGRFAAQGSTTSLTPRPGTSGTRTAGNDAPAESAGLSAAESAERAFAPGTRDGPGWITHPIPTSRIRRYWTRGKGAAKIRWGVPGDFNRCRRQLAKYIANPAWLAGACANMHKEALGIWPGQHRGRMSLVADGQAAPIFTLVAAGSKVLPKDYFAKPEGLTGHEGIVVDGDHVYGYLATWRTCHIGISGVCTAPPYSPTNYSYFATGVVETEEGPINVGQITMDTGHASLKSNAKVAAAHYDNTGAAVADIAVGEDVHGIWFSGMLRSTATEEQRHALRASGRLSGDWRTISGSLELVAALAVNVPGFPIPHALAASADGAQTALVAAGVVPVEEEVLTAAAEKFDSEKIAAIVRTAVEEYRHAEKREARVTPLRETLRQKRIESLRSKITKE